MGQYTFAELLTIFFYLYQDTDNRITQSKLAEEVEVSRRTISSWFTGDFLPRDQESIKKIAHLLCLTSIQADMLSYSANPEWIIYGTPTSVLTSAKVIKYREDDTLSFESADDSKSNPRIFEKEWQNIVKEDFESNYQRWGEGIKRNGICEVEREIAMNYYCLKLNNKYHEDVFMTGDSSFLTPKTYYFTIKAKLVNGKHGSDGYGLVFEGLSDECYALLRVRDIERRISVVQTFDGGDTSTVYARQIPVPSLRPHEFNKLAILAINESHFVYINDSLISHHNIARLSCSRLDVGIIAGKEQDVVCHYKDLRIFVP